ncbi:MAG TPA: hypothetical protein VEF76_00820 [Patescibacteria group bacterium]|nr:hypothetical protein [Patescibacteria group bacterium]
MKKLTLMLGVAVLAGGIFVAAPSAQAETVVFTQQNRTYLGDWIMETNKGCPAGTTLVKEKHLLRDPSYRCIAPKGSNVMYFKPGQVIPQTVTWQELPTTVVQQLPPPPSGEVYVTDSTNVYLVKPETRTVVDAVTIVQPAE